MSEARQLSIFDPPAKEQRLTQCMKIVKYLHDFGSITPVQAEGYGGGEFLMSDCEIARKCKNCGKKISIIYPNQWVYKIEKHKGLTWDWFCSWHCMREAEKKMKPKKMKVIT